jgi:hypothetical protein
LKIFGKPPGGGRVGLPRVTELFEEQEMMTNERGRTIQRSMEKL